MIQAHKQPLPYTLAYGTPDQAVAWLRFREEQLANMPEAVPELCRLKRRDWREHCEWFTQASEEDHQEPCHQQPLSGSPGLYQLVGAAVPEALLQLEAERLP